MLPGIPRITIMVITYKQENIVGRTLDSLIAQRDYLYEICVSDDCSPDGTWDVLTDYQRRYPDLIKIHRQEHNVGIFENTEYSWTMPTGDIVNEIAGDDITPDGWYKAVVDFIIDNKIDYKNELFCIYGDYLVVYGNGDSRRARNNAIAKCPQDALRLVIRNMINDRGCCYSVKILSKFEKVSKGRSYYVEFTQDRQKQLIALSNYYIPAISNVYYAGIGVSTNIQEDTYNKARLYFEEFLKKKGLSLCNKDHYFNKYVMARGEFRKRHHLNAFIRMLWYKLISIDFSMPYNTEATRQLVFAVRRRIPHKKPIHFD